MLSLRLYRSPAAGSLSASYQNKPYSQIHKRQMSANTPAAASAGPPGPTAADQAGSSAAAPAADPIVQWVVLRRDLWQDLGWPLGAVVAQACHASTAAVFSHMSDDLTQEYIHADNIDHMHKVGRSGIFVIFRPTLMCKAPPFADDVLYIGFVS
jgi:hypothetical protein